MKLMRSRTQDVPVLYQIQRSAFKADVEQYGPLEGSPGLETQVILESKLDAGHYYTIFESDEIIGGIRVIIEGNHGHISRIFIDENWQNRGIGKAVLSCIFNKYKRVSRWTLDTPKDHQRNRYFYESMGFRPVGEVKISNQLTLVDYECEKPINQITTSIKGGQFDVILIDLDNTLFDFNAAEKYALQATLEKMNLFSHYEAFESAYIPINARMWQELEEGTITKEALKVERFAESLKQVGLKADAKLMSEIYVKALSEAGILFDGAIEVLDILSQKYKLIALSNGIQEVQEGRLKKSGVEKYFQDKAISEKIGVSKPHPLIFHKAIELAHYEGDYSRVLMVGDSLPADIKGASQLGIKTCWMNYDFRRNRTEIDYDYEINVIEELLRHV